MAHLKRWKRKNPQTGKKSTYYVIYDAGVKAMALGFLSEREAQDLLKKFEAARVLGLEQQRETSPSSKASVPTVRDWWGEVTSNDQSWTPSPMLDFYKARGKSGKALINCNDSRKRIVGYLGGLRLDQITVAVGDRFVARLRSRGNKSRTVQMRVAHLQEGLNVAVEYGVLESAPKLRRPRLTDKKETSWLTPAQASRLVTSLHKRSQTGDIDPVSHLAILTCLVLGLRKNEALTRRWSDLDMESWTLAVRPQQLPDGTTWRPKTIKANRRVAIPEPLATHFRLEWERRGSPTGWIFPNPTDPGRPRTCFRRALRNTCIKAGVPVLTPHELRHTAATGAAFAGATMADLMAIFGWASERMPARIYTHTTAERMRGLVAAANPMCAAEVAD
jgi:integrase